MSNETGTSDSSSPSFSGSRGPERFDESNYRLQHFPSSGGHQDVRMVETLSRSLTNPPSRGKPRVFGRVRRSTNTMAGPSSARTFDPFPTFEQNGTWTSPFLQQSPQSLPTEKPHAEELPYWRPPELSLPRSHPQHPYSATQSAGSFVQPSLSSMEHTPVFGNGGAHGWSASPHPQPRSMSLVGPDEITIHYQNHYYLAAPNEFNTTTNPSEMQPSTLSSNTSTMSSSDHALAQPGTGSFHEPTAQNMNYVYPPTWSSIHPNHNPRIPASAPERFTQGWYSDPSILAQVKEDEVGSHFHHPPHPGYLPHQANPG